MPNPKRRHSRQRQATRRAQTALKAVRLNHCGRCGAAGRGHTVCENCGYYGFAKGSDKKGTEVLQKEEF